MSRTTILIHGLSCMVETTVRDHIESQRAQISELETENERLRKIAAHVPGKVYIEAKEAAGFGARIVAKQEKK